MMMMTYKFIITQVAQTGLNCALISVLRMLISLSDVSQSLIDEMHNKIIYHIVPPRFVTPQFEVRVYYMMCLDELSLLHILA